MRDFRATTPYTRGAHRSSATLPRNQPREAGVVRNAEFRAPFPEPHTAGPQLCQMAPALAPPGRVSSTVRVLLDR